MTDSETKPDAIVAVENWLSSWMSRDLEAMKSVASDDYIQWHSTVRKELTKDEEFAMLVEALKAVQIKFNNVELTPLSDNAVLQQCVADMTINGVTRTGVPIAMVYRTWGRQITRCDEYMDGMSLPPIDFTP